MLQNCMVSSTPDGEVAMVVDPQRAVSSVISRWLVDSVVAEKVKDELINLMLYPNV